MNESPIYLLAAIAGIFEFLISLYTVVASRTRRRSHVRTSGISRAWSRALSMLGNALVVGSFWGWYLPRSPNLDEQSIVLLLLSLHWFCIILPPQATKWERGVALAVFSTLSTYAVLLYIGVLIYGREALIIEVVSPEMDTVTCVYPLILAFTSSLIGSVTYFFGWLFRD